MGPSVAQSKPRLEKKGPSVVFLDRDGVINADRPDYIKSVREWDPLPGSLQAIARLTAVKTQIVVVTNQSGLARGLLSEADLAAIHAEMTRQVEAAGGRLAGIFYCPHDEHAGCRCRKPEPGLIEQACEMLGLEAFGAPMVGDRERDLEAARAAGCRPILVGQGGPTAAGEESYPDLSAAVDALLFG